MQIIEGAVRNARQVNMHENSLSDCTDLLATLTSMHLPLVGAEHATVDRACEVLGKLADWWAARTPDFSEGSVWTAHAADIQVS
jgi:hypothetical protein